MAVGDINSDAVGTAARYNDGKPDFSLVPLVAFEECAKVFDYGRKKYSEWNWAKGQDWSHPYASLMRHLSAWQQGEDIDPESGLPHLGHAMCNMVMLSTFAKTYPQGDNRPNKNYFKKPNEEVTPIEPSLERQIVECQATINKVLGTPEDYGYVHKGEFEPVTDKGKSLFKIPYSRD